MSNEAIELLKRAMTLSAEERAELASSLIDSLDSGVDEGAAQAWDEEIAKRVQELDAGKAATVPWDEVENRIAAKLRHE